MIPAELQAAAYATLLVGLGMHPARKSSYGDVFTDKARQGLYQLAPSTSLRHYDCWSTNRRVISRDNLGKIKGSPNKYMPGDDTDPCLLRDQLTSCRFTRREVGAVPNFRLHDPSGYHTH